MNLSDIAKLANVSTATVSRTINRVASVDPVLARKVWRVIKQEGYYPNTNARALASGRSRTFGLLVSEIINPFFPEIIQTFTQLAIKHNYEVLLTSIVEESTQMELAARRMIERRVEGVALLTFGREGSLIEVFINENVPVFVIDADSPGELIKTVRVDYYHGIRQAVQHLAALGHTEIAFVGGPAHLKTAAMRIMAFRECMDEIGLTTCPELLVDGDHTMEAGVKAMSALAALPRRPSAVVCSNDLTAIGIMRQAFELSIDVPRDLSVVGFDDIPLAELMIPPLTTVRMSSTEIAATAFTILRECADADHAPLSREVTVIKTNLVHRRTTALAPARRKEVGAATDQIPATKGHRERPESLPVVTSIVTSPASA